MTKQMGFIAQKIMYSKWQLSKLIKLTNSGIFMTVHAEDATEPPATPPPVDPPAKPSVNFEDLISKARKEEKDKLYPQIESLKTEKNEMVEKNNKSLLTIQSKDVEIADLQKQLKEAVEKAGKTDTEQITTLKSEIAVLQQKLEKAEKEKPDIAAIEERLRAEYEVKLYREQKLREAGESVIPELVMGTTKEEVDASILASKTRFEAIQAKIMGSVNIPPVNASSSKFSAKEFNMEDFAKLDPRSQEYRDARKKLGLK